MSALRIGQSWLTHFPSQVSVLRTQSGFLAGNNFLGGPITDASQLWCHCGLLGISVFHSLLERASMGNVLDQSLYVLERVTQRQSISLPPFISPLSIFHAEHCAGFSNRWVSALKEQAHELLVGRQFVFRHIWDGHIAGLVGLLAHSQCKETHVSGRKLKGCSYFVWQVAKRLIDYITSLPRKSTTFDTFNIFLHHPQVCHCFKGNLGPHCSLSVCEIPLVKFHTIR